MPANYPIFGFYKYLIARGTTFTAAGKVLCIFRSALDVNNRTAIPQNTQRTLGVLAQVGLVWPDLLTFTRIDPLSLSHLLSVSIRCIIAIQGFP